jgi:natural product biosynthesis luciferase-like monooxygenase protein
MTSSMTLSHIQQGMLYHHLSGSPAGVDLEQIVGELRHELDPELFAAAWQAVAARHAAFRTRFRWEGVDAAVQDVLPVVDVPVVAEDWRDRDTGLRDADFAALVESDRALGFDLSAAPLVRVRVVRFGVADTRMLWSFPHIIMDGRSFPIILRDVFETYDALVRGEMPAPAPAPSSRAFIEWLGRRDTSGDAGYWGELLRGVRGPTRLPCADSNAAAGAPRHEATLELSTAATRALADFATGIGATVNAAVQAAWGILLARHAGEADAVFGVTRSGRQGTVEDADAVAGVFINTLPVRVRLDGGATVTDVLRDVRGQHVSVRPFEHTPLVDVQRASEVPAGRPLFESIIVFDRATLGSTMRAPGGAWQQRDFTLLERTSFPLTLYGYAEERLLLKLAADEGVLTAAQAERLLEQMRTLLEGMPAHAEAPAAELPMLAESERRRLLVEWNDTRLDVRLKCVHELFAERAHAEPDRVAAAFEGTEITYAELDRASNRLARHLRTLGVGPDVPVGLCLDRSLDLLVGILGIHKAGGAYVPLDPEYPADRIEYMIRDSGTPVLVVHDRLVERLPPFGGKVLRLDTDWPVAAALDDGPLPAIATPANLAYAIYTSGSTGRPKGVQVEHRNVANFFAAMDARLGADTSGAFLAITSLSFDISVLELLWTVCRGQKVVLFKDDRGSAPSGDRPQLRRKLDFSLFYFSSDEGAPGDRYRLLKEGARFADARGFSAVWTPERHFHAFGGLFPNPSVTSAAIAAMTERVQIRSGSVVLPLHHPVRVAEEWSVVDNLSNGRVGMSVASGWQPNDFVLMPGNHAARNEVMYETLEQVRRLWRGESLPFDGPMGTVDVQILPRPVQQELPVWITAAGSPETFRRAGAIGANILTHLLGQSLDSLSRNIATYRDARRAAGHQGRGQVTLMLHTFIGDDRDAVRELVREPMKNYLRSAVSLVKNFSAEWTAYSKRAPNAAKAEGDEFTKLAPEDLESLLDFAFERYFETSGLFGTPESCLAMTESLKGIGVDEAACLIDFGVDQDTVLRHLEKLDTLRQLANREPELHDGDYSLAAQVARYGVTTMQCTPSMATILLTGQETRSALGALDRILLGGEAFPTSLANELRSVTGAELVNMYGPTETTVWSSTHDVRTTDDPIPLGAPIANTTFYVLDAAGGLAPIGVPGELYIGGLGVVRGYHALPELTAQRFVPDPFSDDPAARLYRTGDVVRYDEDGTLFFLGRTDNQVKIRGHRIELGEIEASLKEHPGVSQAVVVARSDVAGDDLRLVAYLVPKPGAKPASGAVREHLRKRLPEYMVPTVYMTLSELPLTPNAKIDRKALPAVEYVEAERVNPFVSPASELERAITVIWQEMLNVPSISIRDNFFDLGGHSLLAVQVHGRLRRDLGRDLALTDLFRFPTVQSLAAHLGGGDAGAAAMDESTSRADVRRKSMQLRRQRRS